MDDEGAVDGARKTLRRKEVSPVDEKRGIEGLLPQGRDVGLVSPPRFMEGRTERARAIAQRLEIPGLPAMLGEGENGQAHVRPGPVDGVEDRDPSRGRREQDEVGRTAIAVQVDQVLSETAAAGSGAGTTYAAAPPVIDSAMA